MESGLLPLPEAASAPPRTRGLMQASTNLARPGLWLKRNGKVFPLPIEIRSALTGRPLYPQIQ